MTASEPRGRAIVTGAASGLGRALARRLGADGWHLALADTNQVGCRETAALVQQAGGSAQVEMLDVSRPEQWAELVARLQSEWSELDLLVNNAGVAAAGEVGAFALDDWRWLLDVNLFGVIYGCHACRDWLLRNPRGAHVVNIASAAAFLGAPTMAAYNVSKAGVVALSETMYTELRGRGVGVTVVMPGFFATNLVVSGRFLLGEQRESANALMRSARLTADAVADATVRAIAAKRLYVVLPRRARVFWRLRRWFPTALLKFISWIARRQRPAASPPTVEPGKPVEAARS